MAYDYQQLRPELFTDEGQRRLLAVRDRAQALLTKHGHATLEQLIYGFSGSDWDHIACVDRLVELGELHVIAKGDVMQHTLYRGKWST